MKKVTDWLLGRTNSFCIAFFISGNVLQIFHRLDGTYIAFMAALLGAIIGHSIKDDYADKSAS